MMRAASSTVTWNESGVAQRPGVAQEQRNLLADALEDEDVLLVEPAALLPPHEIERPDGVVVNEQRDHQARSMRELPEERVGEPRVGLDVVAPYHLSRSEDGRAESLILDRQRSGAEHALEVLGNAVAGNRNEHRPLAIDHMDSPSVRPGEAAELPAGLPQRLGEVPDRKENLGNREERSCRVDATLHAAAQRELILGARRPAQSLGAGRRSSSFRFRP